MYSRCSSNSDQCYGVNVLFLINDGEVNAGKA